MEKLLPQLRFPEFRGAWEEKSLKEIVKINQGLQIPISDRLTEQIENSYFYITNEFLKANSEKKYFVKNPNQSVLCTKEDILMTRTGNTGMVVTNVEGVFHNNFFKVAYPNYIDKTYLYNFLKLDGTQNLIKKLAGTSTIPDLNHSDFYSIEFQYPSLPEQTKIASFLTAVDEKLAAVKKKKTLLEQYKKGVMQQIFSQELSFKDDSGIDFADWEEKKLGDFCTFFSGGTPTSTNQKYYTGVIPFIGSGNIYDSEVYNFISDEALKSSSAKIVQKGDLLYALYGANSGELAISKMNGAINQAILCIRNEECITYLYYVLLLNKDNIVATYLQGGQGNLSTQIIKRLNYKFPSIPEQTKIANFLAAIDEKINHCQEQIEKATIWKKGLLQQLFV
ncbi:MAG: restriction endonuclease subunit S [Paludibacter sp.]|nr:restriction endonuclease subunit S [Paludibacter sp.]